MNNQERELRQEMDKKISLAQAMVQEGKLEEARAYKAEAEKISDQIKLAEELRGMVPEVKQFKQVEQKEEKREVSNDEKSLEYRNAFLKSFRGADQLNSRERELLQEKRAMNSSTGEDGGFLIPSDIQTMINEVKRQFFKLEDLVTVQSVSTNSGSRVLEKFVDITPFAQISAENTNLAALDNPKVQQLAYTIKDYGGIMTLTNNLLADSPENIMSFVSNWIARKEIITDNSLILAILQTLTNATLAGTDDIKKALNVTLDPMIAQTAVIVTNQDGYNFLDGLKDTMGRYLLQPDPTASSGKMLFGKPVNVMANRLLPTTGTTTKSAPFIVGDLKQAAVIFDRQEMSILSTNIGGGSFETNTTKVRVIDREDVVKWDADAAIYGKLTLA